MTHFALSISAGSNDLHLDEGGSLAVVTDASTVAQHVRQRLMTYRGEWFLDTTAGVPWLTDLMGKAYDPALAEAVLKAEVLATDGVAAIESFSIGFRGDVRELSIRDVTVRTMYDEVVSV